MRVFAVPYRVLFHDTMAYGTHHFLTNFKFQCLAREHLFFGHIVDGESEGRALHERTIIFTREAYGQSLGPAAVGDRVAILLTVEAITELSLRFCFRVVHETGRPITAGYQTMVAIDSQTQRLVGAPPWLRNMGELLLEGLSGPDFATRLHAGRSGDLFSPQMVELARQVLAQREFPTDGQLVELPQAGPAQISAPQVRAIPAAPAPASAQAPAQASAQAQAPATPAFLAPQPGLRVNTAFLFPGQGSYDPRILRGLIAQEDPAMIAEIDQIGISQLGGSLMGALRDPEAHDTLLSQNPDLGQIGIFLLGVLGARLLARQGVRPDIVMGHSLGEIAALSVAGAMSPQVGAQVVAHRVLALRALGPAQGGMLAVVGPVAQTQALLRQLGNIPAWANVINTDDQLVVTGRFDALEHVERAATAAGLKTRRLLSPFPFHSPLLEPAVSRFEAAIAQLPLSKPTLPVLSPTVGALLGAEGPALAAILARQLTTPLSWPGGLRWLADHGVREFLECGGNTALTSFTRKVLGNAPELKASAPLGAALNKPAQASAPAPAPAPAPVSAAPEAGIPEPEPDLEPIAIISMGCVLPNSVNPDDLWQAVVEERNGISDAGKAHPELASDFLVPGTPVPDKTYSLLGGFIVGFEPALSTSIVDPSWSASQRYLAEALVTCQQGLKDSPDRVFLGSTADGTREYDEALLLLGLSRAVSTLPLPEDQRDAATQRLTQALNPLGREADSLAPHTSAQEVVTRCTGPQAKVVLVDAACASSLYALDAGVRALRQGRSDLSFCGGVFAPGPANSCLFSQFRGLSATGSRPFDRSADGVVFGDGAVVIALRRLSDAQQRGEKVLGVIREIGVSSDGRGPSVALPRADGQVLAMRRAWSRVGMQPAQADYVEAHATATPVGDAVEFKAIRKAFEDGRDRKLPLGSLKALTGHTGWAAGAASVIKVVKAMQHCVIPAQAKYKSPNANIQLGDWFEVPTESRLWNPIFARRRAGVNGFGFGGSNAHVLLEEAQEAVPTDRVPKAALRSFVVVGVGSMLPGSPEEVRAGQSLRLGDEALELPRSRPILPDVLEDMDRSQRMAVVLANEALPSGWEPLHQAIGVVLGLEGKTERSIEINQRLYRDQIRRHLADTSSTELVDALIATLDTIRPSGPYTLPGLMPNVAAGRVSNFFDLMGPNMVVDAGASSMVQALTLAGSYLSDGVCKLVVAGGLSATTAFELQGDRPLAEAGLALALCTEETAQAQGWTPVARITLGEVAVGESDSAEEPVALRGASGAIKLIEALQRAKEGLESRISWANDAVHIGPVTQPPERSSLPALRLAEPRFVPSAPGPDAEPPAPARCLVLVEEDLPELEQVFPGATLLRPAACAGPERATAIDLSDDEGVRKALGALDPKAFDAVIVARGPGVRPLNPDPLAELLFATARALETQLSTGAIALGSLCLGAVREDGRVSPSTGTLSGLVKALARDWPQGRCRALLTDRESLAEGLKALARAWASTGPVEQLDKGDTHGSLALVELLALGRPGPALVGPGELVLVTGGARGVTALLAESLLKETGCTLVLLGRSRIDQVPEDLLDLADDDIAAWEPGFYQRRRAEDPKVRMQDLRAELSALLGSRETARTLRHLRTLGTVELCSADLSDTEGVIAALQPFFDAHGRPALIVHGAGVQDSGALARKRLEDFRRVLSTKLGGLEALLAACEQRFPGQPPQVHALSSAFSVLGNDGQHGYGAANEALMRRAAWEGAPSWTALAWPGWAGIGMTRGSEYAALARSRNLRPMLGTEGQAVFMEMVGQRPSASAVAVLSDAELRWAGEPLLEGSLGSWPMDPESHPHTADHCIDGRPTLPGTFGLELLLRAVRQSWPGWHMHGAFDLSWEQFARLRGPQATLRASFKVLEANAEERLIEGRLSSDLVHANGTLLRADMTHFRARILLRRTPPPSPRFPEGLFGGEGRPGRDPYVLPGSALGLTGIFRCIEDVRIFPGGQHARFELPSAESLGLIGHFTMPALLMDVLCRVAMFRAPEPGGTPVFFPFQCRRLTVLEDFRDRDLLDRPGPIRIIAARARGRGAEQESAFAAAIDGAGDVLIRAEGLVGRAAGRAIDPDSPTAAVPSETTHREHN